MTQAYQTPLEDLKSDDLKHYEELSNVAHHWKSGIPKAINFYYDYKQMNLFQRILLAFKNK